MESYKETRFDPKIEEEVKHDKRNYRVMWLLIALIIASGIYLAYQIFSAINL